LQSIENDVLFFHYDEYEVKDFYIRFPHYEKNHLFMPVIRYILDGREEYQRMYMSLYDWQRLFEAECVDLKAVTESENQEYHFVKTILSSRDGRFFESYLSDEEDNEEALQMRLDGGGEFNDVAASWFVFKSALSDSADIESELAELADKADDKYSPMIRLTGEKGNVKVEIAMFYAASSNTKIRSYVNSFETRCGGSHCDGALAGIADVFNKYLQNQETNCYKITKSDIMEGLYAVIKINDRNFAFDPNALEVVDKELGKTVKSIVKKEFGNYLSENPAIAEELGGEVRTAAQARKCAEAARKMIQKIR
jgi:hypothetical protein